MFTSIAMSNLTRKGYRQEPSIWDSSFAVIVFHVDRPVIEITATERFLATVNQQIAEEIMVTCLRDKAQTWTMKFDGRFVRHKHLCGFNAHRYFMAHPCLSGQGSAIKGHARSKIKVCARCA